MKPQDTLKAYQEKRQFGKTPEPPGGSREASATPMFVVQKHAARTLHYDFAWRWRGCSNPGPCPRDPR